jgi:hypothetical protein
LYREKAKKIKKARHDEVQTTYVGTFRNSIAVTCATSEGLNIDEASLIKSSDQDVRMKINFCFIIYSF